MDIASGIIFPQSQSMFTTVLVALLKAKDKTRTPKFTTRVFRTKTLTQLNSTSLLFKIYGVDIVEYYKYKKKIFQIFVAYG